METKEIGMSKRTKLLTTTCIVAAAFAGPAAADQLEGFNGFADAQFDHTTYSSCGNSCHGLNAGTFGAGMALPLADLPNLNWQLDASYSHQWSGDYDHVYSTAAGTVTSNHGDSQEVWNFGFSPFWAGPMSRVGLNLNYETVTHSGFRTNGGAFAEWYVNDSITVSGKGGYLADGGAEQGGHGFYLGAAATFYGTPDLAITASIDDQDVVSGFGCSLGQLISRPSGTTATDLAAIGSVFRNNSSVSTNHSCISGDVNAFAIGIDGEFLPWEDLGLAIYAGFTYRQYAGIDDFNTSTFLFGLRYYTGVAGGPLVNRHRNGNLHTVLRGP
jgi:hypothetical protein